MAVAAGGCFASDAFKLEDLQGAWAKQVSLASTAAPPTTPDASGHAASSPGADSDADSDPEPKRRRFEDVDFCEARGGLALYCDEAHHALGESRSVEAPEMATVDFYEARGGMASWAAAQGPPEVDLYEARGGEPVLRQLLEEAEAARDAKLAPWAAAQRQADLHEVRGGLAQWLARGGGAASAAAAADAASDLDFYETRGGMAAMCREPPRADVASSLAVTCAALQQQSGVDLYEVRGGMAEWLSGAAAVKASA